MNKQIPGTEPSNAPDTVVARIPLSLERQGQRTEPYSARLPQIRGGICEWCGTKDPNVPSQYQYKLCDHYRNLDIDVMQCSYCEDTKDPVEVVRSGIINVARHPNNPSQLVAWCNSYECSKKHETRFRVNM